MPEPIVWAAALGVLGAIVGSFVAALAIRWPEGRSVMRGRSACDTCGATLRAIDLVPLLSALASRGRCRRCRARIDPLHWQVELAGLAIGALAGFVAAAPVAIAGAVFGWLLLALAVLDLRAFWLPDRLTATLGIGGVVTGALDLAPSLGDRIVGGIVGFGALAAIAIGYRRYRGRDGMGGGDPKLFGAIGLWLGWRMLPAVLLVASAIGLGVVALAWALRRPLTRDAALPFGTLLCIAAYLGWIAMIGFAP